MGNQYYDDSDEEAAEAQRRIDSILGGGGGQTAPQQQPDEYEDPLGGSPRVELRSRAARSALGMDQQEAEQPRQRIRTQGGRAPAPRAQQALLVIGGIVALGIVAVIVIIVLASMSQSGAGISLPFLSTATPTPTNTPTPTPTATATPTVPPLQLPNLTCLVQSTTGCLTYCQNIDNLQECDQARAVVENQKADFTVFLKCLEPVPGPNTGNVQQCLEDAYRAKNP